MGTSLQTFGLIKPEGLQRKLATEILRRIAAKGLLVEEKRIFVMNELQFELLYGHVKGKVPHLYPLMRNYLTNNQSMALIVGGEDALRMLLEIRGASNAADSPPGTIRGDYAKDQDYNRLIKEGKIALNVFHAADSKGEAARDIAAFFGSDMHG